VVIAPVQEPQTGLCIPNPQEIAHCSRHSPVLDAGRDGFPCVDDPVWSEAAGRLALLCDGDFSHFVATTTEISHHIKIDPKSGTVATGTLFNIESVPAETLLFAPSSAIGQPSRLMEACPQPSRLG
jgi:hypothetical protein